MKNPLISVILPVYNSEKYLYKSIDSILKQTFTEFELLILNDGSSDSSEEIINSFDDERIRIFSHENMGLSATLNKGINLSRSNLIARQDADDISCPNRLEFQFNYMSNNYKCNLLGTSAQIIETDQIVNRFIRPPLDDLDCKFQLLFKNCFVHSSVMFRKSILKTVGLYSLNQDRRLAEDYDLWSRISRISKVSNLIDTLVYYRELPNSLSKQNSCEYNSCVIKICSENLSLLSGSSLNDSEANTLASILYGPPFAFKGFPNFFKIDLLIFNISKAFRNSTNNNFISRDLIIMSFIYKIYWLFKCTPMKFILKVIKIHFKFILKIWYIFKEKFVFKRVTF